MDRVSASVHSSEAGVRRYHSGVALGVAHKDSTGQILLATSLARCHHAFPRPSRWHTGCGSRRSRRVVHVSRQPQHQEFKQVTPYTPRIYGITCLQVYIYFLEYAASDRKLLPAFVGSLWYVTPKLCYSLSVFILLEGSGHPPSGIGMPLHLLLCCLQLRRLWRPSKGRVLSAHIFKL
jgi:hypothetical protein